MLSNRAVNLERRERAVFQGQSLGEVPPEVVESLQSPTPVGRLVRFCSRLYCRYFVLVQLGQRNSKPYPGYSQSISTPSAPVASIISLTLLAQRLLDMSSRAASSKPNESPHPPMATMTLVEDGNLQRTASTEVKSGYSFGALSALNRSERRNARMTCVIPCRKWASSGMTLCCLLPN